VKTLTAGEMLQKAAAGKGKAMKALFVVNAYAADEFRRQLVGAGFDTGKTVEFEENDVHVFTKEELTTLLEKAQLCISKKAPSHTQNVEWVWLKAMPRLPQRVLDRMGVPNLEAFSGAGIEVDERACGGSGSAYRFIISSMLYPLLKRPIKFTVPHGDRADYYPDGPFQIYIWSAPEGSGTRRGGDRIPERVWGIETLCRDASFIPMEGRNPAGVVIYDGDYAVAELLPNALYVHHDLVHYDKEEELELFVELLKHCRALLTGPEAFKKYIKEQEERRLEAERNAFPLLIERSVAKRATRQKNAIEAAQRIAATKKAEYFEAERMLFAERQTLLDPEVMKARFLAEYEKLSSGQVELIEGVTFNPRDDSSITLHTGEILVDHPHKGTTHLIGKCDATFNLETGSVRIINRDRPYKSAGGSTVHTPHVFDERGTNVCLGNIGQELVAYIAHYELEAAAVLTVAFLQSCSGSSGYTERLSHFPVVDKKQRKAA